MFPTTVWDLVHDAGARDPEALERFARDYRPPVLDYVRRRVPAADGEDICQDVFVRLLAGGVLAKADAEKGSFRSLLRTITQRAVIDWHRRRRQAPQIEIEPAAPEPDFDRAWALHLTERALERLKQQSEGYHGVLAGHLSGEKQDRSKLWIARRKLKGLIRHEIALTCRSTDEIEEEYALLAPYLRPAKKA
ncbi:MAG: RNA polymerase sigma factor [Planctomycetota bacterium]